MKRAIAILSVGFAALLLPAAAQADFGLHGLGVTYSGEDGSTATQAGSHPFMQTTSLALDTVEDEVLKIVIPDEDLKDFEISFPEGLVADRNATPQCANVEFLPPAGGDPKCAAATVVGVGKIEARGVGGFNTVRVYNLVPPPGAVAKLGFFVIAVPVTFELALSQSPPYNGLARQSGVAQVVPFYSAEVQVWGTPAAKAHDGERGGPTGTAERPFLTLPRSCTGPLPTTFAFSSWQGGSFEETVFSHDDGGEPLGMTGCGHLAFGPQISAQPTSHSASSPSGLDFGLDVSDEGLANPAGIAQSDIKKAVVTLPEGMSVNPSQAEGLGVCTEQQLAEETLEAESGEGCPQSAKIGTVEVESPLVEGEVLKGALFVAEPYENRFGSLLALYMSIKSRELGIAINLAGEVSTDPQSGQLTTTFGGAGTDPLPQLPFSHFRLHFKEGARSPLVSPPACGKYEVVAEFTPWANPGSTYETTSAFEVVSGPDEGPCPTGGLPPFRPGLLAGTLNNAAGKYSPFNLRLFRTDSEQEFTRFSIKLPPGVTGKLAGIPYCSDAAIAQAKARTGPLGGHEELQNPSCPSASEVGRTLAGAGVGSALTYAPGKIYLAGPYNGSALSMVAITAGVVGPFDIGTVVVRQALKIDRNTAEVFIDATGSDPIPHIIQGVPVHLRDIRAYVDKPEFVINPTSCERTSTASTLLGSGLDFASEHDNNPVVVSTPFQAADCAALSFDPKLSLKLIGGTKRGAHPRFRGTLTMKRGESNVSYARITLPRSAFLDQSHIGTVCTRVQYAADACPARSVYGYAKAITPLLDTPVEGPVYLRSSEHQLPDLVAALRNGQIQFDLVGRVDSLKGRIRNTFEAAPDAPVDSFVLEMQGGAKGLIVNSTNLCKGKHKAIAEFKAHNGRVKNFRPKVQAKCARASKRH